MHGMGEHTVKATVTIGNTLVTFEGPRDFVAEQVEKYTSGTSSQNAQGKGNTDSNSLAIVESKASERDLVQLKRPRNHPETIAVLGFCLRQSGVEEFTNDDIYKAYIRAGVRPPKVVEQAIRDAKNHFDFIKKGSLRGRYQLTAHGDRTVRFDLPREE
jgi:hypothetical protein